MPLANQSTVTEATRFDDGFKVQGEIFGTEHIAAMHKTRRLIKTYSQLSFRVLLWRYLHQKRP